MSFPHARRDFPLLASQEIVYLDSAATAQKPRSVIDAVRRFYEEGNGNVHRGVHRLAREATASYEEARAKAARFLGAADPREIVFTRGATEAVNTVAHAAARAWLRAGDRVLASELEHHSNIVPWQMACAASQAELVAIPVNGSGDVDLDAMDALLDARTRIVAIAHVSNAIGTVVPVREIAARAHARGAWVLVDGAQAAPHFPVDVRSLGADFYVVSGHKLFGPTGTGVLYGRADLLEDLAPFQGGGEMIRTVTFAHTEYAPIPHRLEAGTPNVAGVAGLGAAIDYLESLGMDRVAEHDRDLVAHATKLLSEIRGVSIVGAPSERIGVVPFAVSGYDPHEVGMLLDRKDIAIRTGDHCAQPLMARLGIGGTCRASFALYNDREDVAKLADALASLVL